ncbi:HAD family hydrolase [Candidatus Altiarchaeota archaeon]
MRSELAINAVIFDMDGVLIDSFDSHHKAWDMVCKKNFGFDVTVDEFRVLFGTDPLVILESLLVAHDTSTNLDLRAVNDEKQEAFRAIAEGNTVLLPGVVELLKDLRGEGVRIGLYSTTSRVNVSKMTTDLGINDYFQSILGVEDAVNGKPAPDGYVKASKMLDVPAVECLVIEDSVNGTIAGKRAGMPVLGVLTGGRTRNELVDAGADIIVATLEGFDIRGMR